MAPVVRALKGRALTRIRCVNISAKRSDSRRGSFQTGADPPAKKHVRDSWWSVRWWWSRRILKNLRTQAISGLSELPPVPWPIPNLLPPWCFEIRQPTVESATRSARLGDELYALRFDAGLCPWNPARWCRTRYAALDARKCSRWSAGCARTRPEHRASCYKLLQYRAERLR